MSGRDADGLEKLIRQIFNRAIEIDGLAHQELKGLALAGQLAQTIGAYYLDGAPAKKQQNNPGKLGKPKEDGPYDQLIPNSRHYSLMEFCRYMGDHGAKALPKWEEEYCRHQAAPG